MKKFYACVYGDGGTNNIDPFTLFMFKCKRFEMVKGTRYLQYVLNECYKNFYSQGISSLSYFPLVGDPKLTMKLRFQEYPHS